MLLSDSQRVLRVSVSTVQVSFKAAKRTWSSHKARLALGEVHVRGSLKPFALHHKCAITVWELQLQVYWTMMC